MRQPVMPHRRAVALALDVELEGLGLGVVVAHPRDARDVAGLGVNGLRLRGEKNDDSLPAPVSRMHVKSMICAHAAVGIDSSEAKRPDGAARHSSVGMPASTEITWRKPSMAARPCLISMIS